eukprot:247536-Pyramimonas_sp.AAC.1
MGSDARDPRRHSRGGGRPEARRPSPGGLLERKIGIGQLLSEKLAANHSWAQLGAQLMTALLNAAVNPSLT